MRSRPRGWPAEAYVKAMGADQVIDYNKEDFTKVLANIDAVFDTVDGYRVARFPSGIGRDFSGRIASLGPGVTEFQIGDPVFGVCDVGFEGAYAEKVAIKAAIIARKPEKLSHKDAAAMALTGLTALVAIEDTLALKPGEAILVQGGAGGVASLSIQIAKHIGARVITTASPSNHAAAAWRSGPSPPSNPAGALHSLLRGRRRPSRAATTSARCVRMLSGTANTSNASFRSGMKVPCACRKLSCLSLPKRQPRTSSARGAICAASLCSWCGEVPNGTMDSFGAPIHRWAGFDSTPGHQYLVPFDPIRVSHLKLFSLRQSTLRIRGANNHLVVKLPTARLFPGRCLLATEAGHLDAASRFFAR